MQFTKAIGNKTGSTAPYMKVIATLSNKLLYLKWNWYSGPEYRFM